jgi:SAM-dependent methyltransferase
MCNPACIQFAIWHIGREDVFHKAVLEVGSCNVNGSFRDHICYFGPASYTGVDAAAGPGVDRICPAEELLTVFEPCSFDLVVSTEMLEHVADWRLVISNLKQLVRPGGALVLTTRSYGFPEHGYPDDYWRFETYDMQRIFSDFHIRALMPDPSEPGVFIKALRPDPYEPNDLGAIRVFSMRTQGRGP